MLTNVFRIGGLHQVSWFQLLPEGELLSPNSTRKERSSQDYAAMQVMRAHMWLQEEGNLSTWTLSDDKVKLWLFLPGRHDSLNPLVHASVTGLKVVGAGLWRAPGECNEIASALSQALRNRIERGFRSMSYVRYGDVFVKCRRQGASELNLRKPLPSCELVFSASEEAIFVHVLMRRKRVRQLVMTDLQTALAQQRSNLGLCENSLSVIVAPNGLTGRLSGCCPDDLVTQLYKSKLQAFKASSLPFHVVASTSTNGSTSTVQPCYAEISLGQPPGSTGAARHGLTGAMDSKLPKRASNGTDGGQVLIYPLDAVLVPMRPVVACHSYIERCWLREWAGTNWLEDGVEEEGLASIGSGLYDGDGLEKSTITGLDANGSGPTRSGGAGISSNSSGGSSSSSSSSQGSSGTSSSSDADGEGVGEMEADAESLGSKAAGVITSKRSNMRAPATPSQAFDLDVGDVKSSQPYLQGTKRGRTKPMVGIAAGDPPAKALKRSNSIGNDIAALMDGPINEKRGAGFLGEPSGFGGGMSSSMGGGTPRGGGSQLGNPWDQWDNDNALGLGMGLGMDIQSDADILAEFGDFGDFFEDDGLGFGEPPDTAESEALMFPLPEYGEVTQTPGTAPLDASDPMLLPILDFPLLEMNQNYGIEPLSARGTKPNMFKETSQAPAGVRSSPPVQALALDSRLKAEAMFFFAPGFEDVDTAGVPDVCSAISRDPYVPDSKKSGAMFPIREPYVYSATPPLTAKLESSDGAKGEKGGDESPSDRGETKKKKEPGSDYIIVSSSHGLNHGALNGQAAGTEGTGPDRAAGMTQAASNKRPSDASGGGGNGSQIPGDPLTPWSPPTIKNRRIKSSSGRSPVAVLVTDLECALQQVLMFRSQDYSSSVSSNGYRSGVASPGNGTGRATPLPVKEGNSDFTQSDILTQSARGLARPQQERRKKVPERIAGHADDDMQDGGNRAAQVGVWRPVGGPKASQQPKATSANNNTAADFRPGPSNTTSPVDPGIDDSATARQSQWQDVLDAVPLLAQQASVAVDVSLDGHYEDGPLGWLAAQERQRQQRICGTGWSHAGSGGMLAITGCLDNSGMEILNPLSAEISAATVASLLQSDVRVAMSNAFGEASADGPLALIDWCKGRVQASDGGHCGESTNTDSREVNSTITVAGEPITPPQSGGGLKGADIDDMRRSSSSSRALDSSSLSEQTDACQRRGLVDDLALSHSDISGSHEPTILSLPTPALLVGYQDDWLKTSSSTLHLWEKAPLEPYALSKQVNYHVICLASEPLITAAVDFFQQLSSVYEVCRLGSHMPVGMVAGQSGPAASSSKQNQLPGFTLVDAPGVTHPPRREEYSNASSYSLAKSFVASMNGNWSLAEYRKALRKVCKALPISAGSSTTQRDPEQGHCTVVYVVCPVSDPAGILQTMIDACASLGPAISGVERDRRAASGTLEDDGLSNILGFSSPRFALQLITAETIFKTSGPQAPGVDVLKEVALGVYNKVRRIPRRAQRTDCLLPPGAGGPGTQRGRTGNTTAPPVLQTNATLPGMWKDCSIQRSSGNATMGALDSANNLNTWEAGWKPSSQTDAGNTSGDTTTQDTVRYLYEPAFILAEAGTPDAGVGLAPARTAGRDTTRLQGDEASGSTHGASSVAGTGADLGSNAMGETSDGDTSASGQPAADLHCCYTWTEDWRWMVSVWTDSRGELLDTQVLPMPGADAQREGALQALFCQVLEQGLQLLAMAVDAGSRKPRGLNITRLGGFFEKECQEWHRVILSAGGDEVRKWPVQIRQPHSDSSSGVGGTGSTSDMGLMTDRALGLAGSGPASPSPSSSSFGGRGKTSNYSKSGVDMSASLSRRQGQVTNQMASAEPTKGAFKWVHSISLVSVRVDQSLQIVSSIDGVPQGASSSAPSWPAGSSSSGAVGMGVSTVRTLASTGASYLVVPSHGNRPLAPSVLQLLLGSSCPELPVLAQSLHSSGPACPVATGFTVSGGTTSMVNTESLQRGMKEEWPSTLSVGLVAHYSASSRLASPVLQDVGPGNSKIFKSPLLESKEQALEAHRVLQVVAAELHALSWLTVGLTYVHRRSPLPFHCEVAQRLQRLLGFLDAECGPSRPLLQV